MYRLCIFSLALLLQFSAGMAAGQSCPKVTYSTESATVKSLVASVNCLVSAEKAKAAHSEMNKGALLVDSFQVVGPQHTRNYKKVALAILSVPTGSEIHTALVTPDNPQASASATAGAECKMKLNSDNSVDVQCNQTGGTLYVVYQN